jgi:lysophospholipase L1-like esterase
MTAPRPEAVEPYVRGAAWPAAADASYPRADMTDTRLPADTRTQAMLPVGVRLEIAGDATEVDIAYEATTEKPGDRGGRTFSVWRGGALIDEQRASLGRHSVRLRIGSSADRAIVYLPERMKPVISALAGVDGTIAPASRQPRWIAYGDSVVEGWVASGPAHSWPAIAGREHGFDVVNVGYAGSARGELATAEHIAALDAHVISLSWGTNCWSRVPHAADMMRAVTNAFIRIIRAGHPDVPIVISSPIVRPDADDTPNALGATLEDLREAMEQAVRALDDDLLTLIPGRDILSAALLSDGVHPGDEGHRVLARALGGVVATQCDRVGPPNHPVPLP